MPIRLPLLAVLTAALVALGAAETASADHHKNNGNGWTNLLGGDLNAWNPRKDGGWKLNDGVLTLTDKGGYIWTKKAYGDFALELEFKMSPDCNSGVFFRTDPKQAVQHGFEIQVLDSHGKKNPGRHDCGALYDAAAPKVNAVKPAGRWNKLVLTCDGPHIRAELNGRKILDLNINDWDEPHRNPDGSPNKFHHPLAELPRKGHIGLQDHGHPVWYRNIRIKQLD